MRRVKSIAVAGLAGAMFAVMLGAGATTAAAQEGPGGAINPGRDCQTVVQCRFTKGGSYRGCISAYSCRVCKLVSARCTVGQVGRKCREFRCSWGA